MTDEEQTLAYWAKEKRQQHLYAIFSVIDTVLAAAFDIASITPDHASATATASQIAATDNRGIENQDEDAEAGYNVAIAIYQVANTIFHATKAKNGAYNANIAACSIVKAAARKKKYISKSEICKIILGVLGL